MNNPYENPSDTDQTNEDEFDYLIKLFIIGDSGVGKTSILHRFTEDKFIVTHITTIGKKWHFKGLSGLW